VTALSKNRSLLLAGVFLFFAAIIFFSSVNAQEGASLTDAPGGVYILAQAPKPPGQQQASQPPSTKTKPGSASGKKAAPSKTTTEDDDDEEEDTQPVKGVLGDTLPFPDSHLLNTHYSFYGIFHG
jgi:predicted lipid-binding transport protein (Tim44 family)